MGRAFANPATVEEDFDGLFSSVALKQIRRELETPTFQLHKLTNLLVMTVSRLFFLLPPALRYKFSKSVILLLFNRQHSIGRRQIPV